MKKIVLIVHHNGRTYKGKSEKWSVEIQKELETFLEKIVPDTPYLKVENEYGGLHYFYKESILNSVITINITE